MDGLISSIKKTLFDSELPDLGVDLAEAGLDVICDNAFVREIPIVKTMVATFDLARDLRARNLLIQTTEFLKGMNERTIPHDRIVQYRKHLDSNPRYARKELGRVLLVLDSNYDLEKSLLLARFYRGYVADKISWEEFCDLSEVLRRILVSDIRMLYKINSREVRDTDQCPASRADRLISLGLVGSGRKGLYPDGDGEHITDRWLMPTEFGSQFCDLAKGADYSEQCDVAEKGADNH